MIAHGNVSRGKEALGKEDRFIPNGFAADALHFVLAAGTEKVEPNTVLLWFDQLAEARSQLGILRLRQVAFKHAVLHPLPVRFEDFMNLGAAFIFSNIVADNNIHCATSVPRVDICLFLSASISPGALPGSQMTLDRCIWFVRRDA